MIAPNTRNQISKRLRKQAMAHKQHTGQVLLNAVLWQIIKNMARGRCEDYDEALDAILTMPKEALEAVPANFALTLGGDDENVSVIATSVKPKSGIILPGDDNG